MNFTIRKKITKRLRTYHQAVRCFSATTPYHISKGLSTTVFLYTTSCPFLRKIIRHNKRQNIQFEEIGQASESESSTFIDYNNAFDYVQFSSVTTLCDPMNCSTPGLPVHHQLPEFTQTHVHRVGVAIQPSHPLSSPSPPAPNPSQHQSLFQ